MLDESAFAGVPLSVVGSICRDVKTAPLKPGEHLLRDGETPTDSITETIGGGGANTAVMAAGLGARVAFAGKVGADPLGDRLIAALNRVGVTSLVRRDPRVATGSSLALSFVDGQRHFISHQPNNVTLEFADIDPAIISSAGGHLLRADIWFSEPMLHGGNAKLFAAARAAGAATSLDLNWDPQWNAATPDVVAERITAVREVLPLVDLVHGNVRELNRFADSDDLSTTLKRLIDWGAGAIVLHLGERGAGYFCGDELVTEPSVAATRQVNSAGTGDLVSTCVMLLHHRMDVSVAEKLRLANRIVSEFIEGQRDFVPTVEPHTE